MFEELAEAYVNSKADGGHFDLEQFGKAYFSESSMKQAFLAGLKAGKDMNVSTKWHDLCKNPNDLPPIGIGVIISGYLGDMKGLHGFDDWDGEKWTNTDIPGLVREAWCEIPSL